jgi:hypothetical protein
MDPNIKLAFELNEATGVSTLTSPDDPTLVAELVFTAPVAQRKVSKLLLNRVGNLLYGEEPSLVIGERVVWRVPVWISRPDTGPLGPVGTLDVDVQTGAIAHTPEILEELKERARALVERTAYPAG